MFSNNLTFKLINKRCFKLSLVRYATTGKKISTTKILEKYLPKEDKDGLVEDVRKASLKEIPRRGDDKRNRGGRNSYRQQRFEFQDYLNHVYHFKFNSTIKSLVLSLGWNERTFKTVMGEFIELIKSDKYPKFKFSDAAKVVSESNLLALDQAILREFLKFGSGQLGEKEKEKFDYIKGLATLENPIHWFPQARKMKRKIIMHVGPTNSGKTYKALQRLKTAPRGVYCGPLRLLAFEIFKRFIDEGIRCNLATGEERIDVEDYISNLEKTTGQKIELKNYSDIGSLKQTITSATIEMLNLSKVYDVAVFDEIQLLSDAQRGWGWLRALVGVQAHEIHLCGEPSAIPFVKEICKQMNEEVIINEYERLSPLKIKENALDGDYKKFKKGDCLVTFSRDGIFEHKDKVEKATGLKCAVVYGRLPPENRAMEAKLFNDPNSGYDIMVASDAVGMGLNLNIQRVVFDSLSKFDGTGIRKVKISQVKQIAGRAGRFGTHFANGEVTSFYKTDVDYLLYCMQQKFAPLKTIGLQPELSILKAFFYQFPNESFSMILIKLMVLCELPKGYFLCYTDDHIKLAGILSEIPLSLEDRLSFLMAPIPARDPQVVKFVAKAITTHSQGHPVNIKDHLNIPNISQMNDEDYLKQLETCHRCIMLYLWLSYRFPLSFHDVETCKTLKLDIEDALSGTLHTKKILPKSKH